MAHFTCNKPGRAAHTKLLPGGVWRVGGMGGEKTAKAFRLWIDGKNKGNHGWLNVGVVVVAVQ